VQRTNLGTAPDKMIGIVVIFFVTVVKVIYYAHYGKCKFTTTLFCLSKAHIMDSFYLQVSLLVEYSSPSRIFKNDDQQVPGCYSWTNHSKLNKNYNAT